MADARGIVRTIMLLPCRAATPVRPKVCDRLLDHLSASHDVLHGALAAQTPAALRRELQRAVPISREEAAHRHHPKR